MDGRSICWLVAHPVIRGLCSDLLCNHFLYGFTAGLFNLATYHCWDKTKALSLSQRALCFWAANGLPWVASYLTLRIVAPDFTPPSASSIFCPIACVVLSCLLDWGVYHRELVYQ